MISMRSIAEKSYGPYLTLKILKAIFYPVHMLLWITYASVLMFLGISFELLAVVGNYSHTAKREFSDKFLVGSKHFKNFSRKDYRRIYKPTAFTVTDIT